MSTRRDSQSYLYIREHREALGLTLEQVGDRLGVERNTVWRWESQQDRLNPSKMGAIAVALGLQDWTELALPPGRISLDAMLAGKPDDVREMVADIVARLTRSEP